MPTLATIPFTTAPKVHNMAWPATSPTAITYSGRWIVHVQQWGCYMINADTGVFEWISPVGKIDATFQTPELAISGDCWQSGVAIGVNPTTAKWIVITGTPSCPVTFPLSYPFLGQAAGRIQVCRMDGAFAPHLSYVGEIRATTVGRVNTQPVVVGDTAYFKEITGTTWASVDLNTLTVTATGLGSAPGPSYQTDIDGYVYTISPVVPNPAPNPFPGPSSFVAIRSDQINPGGGGLPDITFQVQVAAGGPSGQTVEYVMTNEDTGTTSSIGLTVAPYSLVWKADQIGRLKVEARLTRGINQYSAFIFIRVTSNTINGTAVLTGMESYGGLITGSASLTGVES